MHRHDDARTLAPAAQAHVRRLAVMAVRAGFRQTAAAKTYGVSLRAVNKWVALDKVGGLRALKPKRRGRRLGEGGRVRVAHAQRIRSLIVDKLPDQLKLPFYLWTRAAVASLIAQEYGIFEGKFKARRVCGVPPAVTQTDRRKDLFDCGGASVHQSGKATRFAATYSSRLMMNC